MFTAGIAGGVFFLVTCAYSFKKFNDVCNFVTVSSNITGKQLQISMKILAQMGNDHHATKSPGGIALLWGAGRGLTCLVVMVKYARVGQSQRKLWWRSAVILTCKSIVKLGYRGKRLIEPSSSWFQP